MTGNSMDAIDLVLSEFCDGSIRDICDYSRPYDRNMQYKMDRLRSEVFDKTAEEIRQNPEFLSIHDEYIKQISDCINEMCLLHNIDKSTIDAVGFHGKTLDHNPPSKVGADKAYTLQIGSGKMLADLTQIPVIYDFRSDAVMQGLDGAPLAPFHNTKIAAIEGDGIYYNGGNTSNFALISEQKSIISSDSGPFNEYTDSYIRMHTDLPYDVDACVGLQGKINVDLLKYMFEVGRHFYETVLPKSGDPAYYHKNDVFNYVKIMNICMEDAVRTFEYFAAYIAVYALTLIPENIIIPEKFILFGGGWKNQLVKESFFDLLTGKGIVLDEHQMDFNVLRKRFRSNPVVKYSAFGECMEARLMADLAYHRLTHSAWEFCVGIDNINKVISGIISKPQKNRMVYDDCINRAAKGWQKRK